MLKKLSVLSLSLLLTLSLLPGQAFAAAVPEDEPPTQAENGEDQVSPEDTDAGIAPCIELYYDPVGSAPKGLGGGIGAGDTNGGGAPWGPNAGT